jgi:hypothetical protein
MTQPDHGDLEILTKAEWVTPMILMMAHEEADSSTKRFNPGERGVFNRGGSS